MGPRAAGPLPPDPAMLLAASAKGLVEELSRSLTAAAGRPVKATVPEVASRSADQIGSRLGLPAAAFCLELGGALSGKAAVILPGPVVCALGGLLAYLSGAELVARAKGEPSDQDLEALAGPLAGSLAGMAEKLSAQAGEALELVLGDALLVGPGAADELLKSFGGGPYPAASFRVEVEGLAGGPAMILFPRRFGAVAPRSAFGSAGAPPGAPGRGESSLAGLHPNVRRILRLKLLVSVVVAEKTMDMESVLKLNPGTILEFDKSADEDLDLMINGQRVGAGEVVIIGERFGIQLRQIEGLERRIRRMGAPGALR